MFRILAWNMLGMWLFGCLQGVEVPSDVQLCKMDGRNQDAVAYVGTRPTGGRCQLELLLLEGLERNDYVLEVGCGALMSSIPIMSYLHEGHFVGMDPNPWLREASLQIQENLNVVIQKQPVFLNDSDFDASEVGISFDYIFAHSIMSHAAYSQLDQFLENTAKVLKEGGKVIFSIRLTEPNGYGCEGHDYETKDDVWQYPGCSFFHKSTVIEKASRWFSHIEYKIEFTEILTNDSPSVCHDWFVLTK